MDDKLPTVSIITVCRNAEELIEATIRSVLDQLYDKIEYIIIDGNSTDNTISIIRKYADYLAWWESSPDNGIYDAMNKGVQRASGEFVYFLNAGDTLANSTIIEAVASLAMHYSDADLLCGRVLEVDVDLKLCRLKGNPLRKVDVIKGCMTPHQGMFARTNLLREWPFSLQYKVAADFEFFLKCLLANKNVVFIDECIAHYLHNGVSGSSDIWINEYETILNKWISPDMSQSYKKHLRVERFKRIMMKVVGKVGVNYFVKKFWRGWKELTIEENF